MNEKRLIDANALQRKLYDDYHGAISDSELKVYQVIRLLEEAPTVAAEPVRHARWEYREELQYFTIIEMMDCSVCGEHQNPEQVEAWAYCPNCGARMDLDPATEKEDSK